MNHGLYIDFKYTKILNTYLGLSKKIISILLYIFFLYFLQVVLRKRITLLNMLTIHLIMIATRFCVSTYRLRNASI